MKDSGGVQEEMRIYIRLRRCNRWGRCKEDRSYNGALEVGKGGGLYYSC